jgi:transaldolase / glucose-6-phosphate isomerase
MNVPASIIRVNPPRFTARGGCCHSPHPIVSPVRIYAGSDHAGVKLKEILVAELRRAGLQVVDFGTNREEATDYPDWAAQVARAVRDDAEPGVRGLITCGSGVGVCIVANKVAGVRAVDAWNEDVARVSRSHNDTNVLCLGARFVDEPQARAILNTWLTTAFEGGRHEQRLGKIAAVEFSEGAQAAVRREAALLAARRVPRRIWANDPTVFVADGETNEVARKSILSRLGWLRSPEQLGPQIGDVLGFAADVRARGFTRAVLLGMGGSSLCPEVLAKTFSSPGIPVEVLDSTDPDAVAAIEAGGDPDRTLFVVASKSGGTIEVASFENHFWRRAVGRVGLERASKQFCAITDLNTELHLRARDRYHQTFVNPSDIGGRYSALSLFGLVPAALLGIDVKGLVGRGQEMARACQKDDVRDNPGASLGAFMGALAKQGRDKLTLLLGPEVSSLGGWIEQLVAESTGKLGRGIVPIDLEPPGPAAVYGDDRAFVVVTVKGGGAPAGVDLAGLRMAGHPVLEIELPDTLALGAEFYRWEFATAVAGASLGINPFDEPNVTEAKEATARAIKTLWQKGSLPDPGSVLTTDGGLAAGLLAHLSSASPGDYICLAAFFRQTPERDRLLSEIRRVCRDRWHVATTLGYGPRFLHSTGQLHKGGPNTGVFIQLTGRSATDLQVPERGFSFGVLRDAQALGDLEALRQHRRRVARVDLGQDIEGGLGRLLAALTAAPHA